MAEMLSVLPALHQELVDGSVRREARGEARREARGEAKREARKET